MTQSGAHFLSPVCLINPSSGFLLDDRVFPTLGLLRLAAVLEQRAIPVEFLDLAGVANFLDVCLDHIAVSSAKAVGLTATTPQLPSVIRIAKALRAMRPDIRLIIGGPHVTLCIAAVKSEKKRGIADGRAQAAFRVLQDNFDVVCAGDGEFAIFEALGPNPPALIDADDRTSALFLTDETYTEMPLPARHLIDMDSYHYSIEGKRSSSIIAQLGCPFSCGFCGGRSSPSLRVIRTRTTESIVGELEHLYRSYGYTGFMFYDDELNVSKTMVELMDAIVALQDRLGVEFRLRGFVKAELFTDAQAAAMRRAGFRWLLSGFETGDPRMLVNINKRATLDDNSRAIEIAKRHDLKVKALMSVGHPGESEESVAASHDWLIASGVDEFDCTIITTYPGTPYYDEATRHPDMPGVWTYRQPKTGDRLHAYEVDFSTTADFYKGIPDGGYTSFVFTDHLSPERLVELRDWVERDVRTKLAIPFPAAQPAIQYEHSMGQGLNQSILRASKHLADVA